jgi:hypothetical protein
VIGEPVEVYPPEVAIANNVRFRRRCGFLKIQFQFRIKFVGKSRSCDMLIVFHYA